MIGTDDDVPVIVYDIGIALAVKARYRKDFAVLTDRIGREEYAQNLVV